MNNQPKNAIYKNIINTTFSQIFTFHPQKQLKAVILTNKQATSSI